MVTPELEVVKVQKGDSIRYMEAKDYEELSEEERKDWGNKKTVVDSGELLTMTEQEAIQLGFSSGTPENEKALLALLQVKENQHVEITWSEKLASFLASISPFLMILAFGLLYMEFQTPGFGIFGILGLSLVAVIIGGQYVSGLADQLPLVFLIIGVALFIVEIIFFPGTWIAGLAGFGFLIAAIVFALRDVSPTLPGGFDIAPSMDGMQRALVLVIGSAIAALLIPLLASRFVLPKMPASISPMLQEGLTDAVSPQEAAPVSVGEEGVVVAMLKPTGKVRFGHQILEAQCIRGFVDAGLKVKVVKVESGHVLVEEV
jgi:membrane-bound serine protease (ClpP class)